MGNGFGIYRRRAEPWAPHPAATKRGSTCLSALRDTSKAIKLPPTLQSGQEHWNAEENILHNIRGHLWGNASCRAHWCVCGVQHRNAHMASSHVGKAMLRMMSEWDSWIAWQCLEQPPTVRARQLQPAWHEQIGYTSHAGYCGGQGRKRPRHRQGRGAVMKHTHGHCRLGHMERTQCQTQTP